MQRSCAQCGQSFEAKRSTAKFCGTTCRTKSFKSGGKPGTVTALPPVVPSGFAESVEQQLQDADLAGSYRSRQAILLARRMESAVSDAAVAGLSKELDRLMSDLLAGSEEPDGIDAAQDTVVAFRRRRA